MQFSIDIGCSVTLNEDFNINECVIDTTNGARA
jgi:hypothetical protein